MSEVETTQTPTQKAAGWGQVKSEEVRDGLGRTLVVEALSVLDQARLFKAIGSEQSGNEAFVNIARLAAMVRSIDGIKYPMPRTAAEVEAAIARMGDAAYMTVMLVCQKWIGATNQLFEEVKRNFEADVKN